MYLHDLKNTKTTDIIDIQCDECNNIRRTSYQNAKQISKHDGKHLCKSCKFKINLRPQNRKEYWTDERKKELGIKIKGSDNYKNSIINRDTSGLNNGMYGKEHSITTKLKMTNSRIGKTGENATAWKGGKNSITRSVKQICHTRYNWYYRVYQRDGFCCTKCGSKHKLDAHHKNPMAKMIKELCKDKIFGTRHEQIEWLVSNPLIIDEKLENGITLCRECHKDEHKNWGSHNIK